MFQLVCHEHRYIIYWSPKCACTTMRALFIHLNGDRDRLHTVNTVQLDAKTAQGYFKIAVVRNPYDRIVSSFVNKAVVFRALNDDVFAVLGRIAKEKKVGLDAITFEMFIDELYRNRQYAENSAAFQHVAKQVCNKPSGFDAVCRVESLKDDLLRAFSTVFKDKPVMLKKAVTYINELPSMNSTSKMLLSQKFHNVPISALRSMKVLPTNVNFLTADLMDRIYEIYKDDFEAFGYGRELPQPVQKVYTLPPDFEWREYLRCNPYIAQELGYVTEDKAKYYYLNYGMWLKHRYKA
jgi:hypothetical protein